MRKNTIVLIWDLIIAAFVLGVTYVVTKYKLSDYIVWAIALWICYLIFVVLYQKELEDDYYDKDKT